MEELMLVSPSLEYREELEAYVVKRREEIGNDEP